ncbi:MAG TPA: translation elongation factor Ts [Candidatus Sumerlaeota bacterium]|nr:translation elongation factor Ts [Candidatus Ozemobacteraceae bacterium]HPS00617.1 translation elongation factor Ts [Candidatus Sumerlaeota bacterium]
MAEISASLVKTLREQTGVGMMECKKALQECDGDIKRAATLLREKGAAKAIKRAGRATKEGKIMAKTTDCKTVGALVEVNIETDFAARSERFTEFATVACDTVLALQLNDVEALMAAKPASGSAATIKEAMTDAQTVIGENMGVSRCAAFKVADGTHGLICTYIHPPVGKVSVMVELACESAAVAQAPATDQLAHDLCLQVAFSNPVSLDATSVPASVVEAEKAVYRNMAIQEGKPEKLLDKIVDGKMKAFFKESCLLEQAFVKEEKKTVGDLVKETTKAAGGKIEIVRFVRYQLGETAEEGADEE